MFNMFRKELHLQLAPEGFVSRSAELPSELLYVSDRWRQEKFDGDGWPNDVSVLSEQFNFQPLQVSATPLGSGVYRIDAPPRRAVGLSCGDLVATTVPFEGKRHVVDILRKSGCRTLFANGDYTAADLGDLVRCLEDEGAAVTFVKCFEDGGRHAG